MLYMRSDCFDFLLIFNKCLFFLLRETLNTHVTGVDLGLCYCTWL